MLAATGAASSAWVALVIVLGLGSAGFLLASTIGGAIRVAPKESRLSPPRCESRAPPPHLLPSGSDAMGHAEHHLLDAADAIVADVDSLAEQRDEFEAILRSMTEAVVVTGRAAK